MPSETWELRQRMAAQRHAQQDPLWNRNCAIIDLSRAGWDRKRLAKTFDVTPERVAAIVSRAVSPDSPYYYPGPGG